MCAWTRPGWQRPSASAVSSLPSSFAEVMSEQLAERLNAHDCSSVSAGDDEGSDPDLALAMALSLSSSTTKQLPEKEGETEGGKERGGHVQEKVGEEEKEEEEREGLVGSDQNNEEEDEEADVALARKLQALETGGGGSNGNADADIDLALALQLQAEEEGALHAARRAAAARDQRQEGLYRKISVSYHGFEEGGWEGGWEAGGVEGRRVLLSADDVPGSSSPRSRSSSPASSVQGKKKREGGGEGREGGREEVLGGLVSIAGPGGGRRRRQKQGELWVTKEGEVISKHDATVNGRLNALELTAQYSGVGDLEGQPDFSIPNGVCNQLRRSLKKGSIAKGTGGVPRGGMESRARRTQEGVLDQRTRLILFKMINKGTLFREVGGVVKTGKESYVFYAPGVGAGGGRDGGRGDGRREGEEGEGRDEVEREGGRGGEEETEGLSGAPLVSPSSASSSFSSSAREGGREGGREGCDCAIKVFKTTLNEFSNRSLYIDGDPRFGKMLFNKQSSRAKFQLWAEKEARNLLRMHKAGIPCPVPLQQKEHVLVMSFLGDDGWPSPQLREVKFTAAAAASSLHQPDAKRPSTGCDGSSSSSKASEMERRWWSLVYRRVLFLVRALYQKASLVHGDLSEYNILWHRRQLYLIDVGQAVHTGHALADVFLARDLKQVHAFFRSKGVRVLGREGGGGRGRVCQDDLCGMGGRGRETQVGGGEEG
ncbi:serine threonine-protein kinase rio3 [Nannochloropsis oceanica]